MLGESNPCPSGGKFNHSFQTDEAGNQAIKEAMARGKYRKKADLFRDAVEQLNKTLKQEATV